MIELSEQSPRDINAELAARLKAAEKRIAELGFGKSDPYYFDSDTPRWGIQ